MKVLWGLWLCVAVGVQSAWSQQTLDIVTDTWAPYAYEQSGQVLGTDTEIALAVLKRLGVEAQIRLLPWRRCLAMMRAQEADAILAVSITEPRKAFMHFPLEPVSTGVTVFFRKAQGNISTVDLANPQALRAGAMMGYKYCDDIDNSPLMKQASRVSSLEQNFNKLLRGRLELVVEVESVGFYTLQQMQLSDRIDIVPDARYCEGGNYLAFAKKPGYEMLAQRFSEALRQFKGTNEYQAILKKYGKP